MPELPEVFTVATAMNKLLVGDTMVSWLRLSQKLRCPVPSARQVFGLLNRPLLAVRRIAKSLYLDFGNERCLHAHLGMTGCFYLREKTDNRHLKHEHLRIELASGRILSFCDPRRFGVIELRALPGEHVVEPFAGELLPDYLASACSMSRRSIKSLIMDQKVIAGLGNIYATEGLLLAGVMPDRPAGSLDQSEIRAVIAGVLAVIHAAIASGEQSQRLAGYVLNSETTHFPIVTHVYGRAGESCGRCGKGTVACIRIAGRSSFYCPVCQK
ncbi:MAG: hypothetical protein PHD82_13075 [Candidatus Riflebacteria bacterium]|jgi:formamidopyrimidine-DNA glycosylase|nr:hypothetical protein [Candidatus Riflebacteria bacterium]